MTPDWFPGRAQVAGYPDGVVRVANDLPGAQLHQVDGGPRGIGPRTVAWYRAPASLGGLANAPSSPGF